MFCCALTYARTHTHKHAYAHIYTHTHTYTCTYTHTYTLSYVPNIEDQYRQMVLDKTGGLFRLAVGLMLSFASGEVPYKDYTKLLNRLSLYFQIRDDYLNVSR